MGDSQKPQVGASQDVESLRTLYGEICRAHDGIADFRGKLLALLPIASGAGIFLLLKIDSSFLVYLPAVGTFGALVTFGLYLHELRGIQRCNVLIECGQNLESEMLGNSLGVGTFTDNPKNALGFVGSTWAARVIYPATIGAWTYLALSNAGLSPLCHHGIAGLVAIGIVAFGWRIDLRQKGLLDRWKEEVCQQSSLSELTLKRYRKGSHSKLDDTHPPNKAP